MLRSQLVGVAFGDEPGVLTTVVAHRNGAWTEVDDLDQVRVAGVRTLVVVVAPMDRVDSAGGNRVTGLLVRRVEHRATFGESSVIPLNARRRPGLIGRWAGLHRRTEDAGSGDHRRTAARAGC